MVGLFATRISGSADIYQKAGKEPLNSINFLTCHDGFTLNDLVSYNGKHNEANGEGNRDGTDENCSYNYGVEGASDDPDIEAIRVRQIKNFIATLFVSRGVPLFLGGDEFRRTQKGNNNAFCQDNGVSWYNWDLLQEEPGDFQVHQGDDRLPREERGAPGGEVLHGSGHILVRRRRTAQGMDLRGPEPRVHDSREKPLVPHVPCWFYGRGLCPAACARGQNWCCAVDTSRGVWPAGREEPLSDRDGFTLKMRSMAILIAR